MEGSACSFVFPDKVSNKCQCFTLKGKKLPPNIDENAEEGDVSDEDSADEMEDDCKLMNGDVCASSSLHLQLTWSLFLSVCFSHFLLSSVLLVLSSHHVSLASLTVEGRVSSEITPCHVSSLSILPGRGYSFWPQRNTQRVRKCFLTWKQTECI